MDCTQKKRTRNLFTDVEDEQIRQLVAQDGEGNWSRVAEKLPGRSARQCKERWDSYLAPHIINGPWSKVDDELLLAKTCEIGHQWKRLESWFPGRSDINIKNHWRKIYKRHPLLPIQSPKPPGDHLEVFDRLFSTLSSEAEDRSIPFGRSM
jgi:hypothetical protein